MPFADKLLGVFILLVGSAAIWLMIASGIETGLRAEYEEKDRKHRRRERWLRRNIEVLAMDMYRQALAGTRVNVTMKASVVEDDLGKGHEQNV